MSTAANLPSASAEGLGAGKPTSAVKFDFPTWLPPMLVKELRQGLRTRGFVGCMVGFQVVMVLVFVWAFAANMFGETNALQTVNGFFWGVVGLLLLVMTPLRAMAGLRQEIDSKSLDLLMLTNLTAWRIVLGKWASLVAQSGLLLIAFLPFGVVRYFFGSIDLVEDIMVVSMMFLGCGVLTAVALWMSGLPKILRFALPVIFFFGLQGAMGLFSMRRMGPIFSMGSGVDAVWSMGNVVFNLILLMAFCLVRAVRRISPPSDNHAPATRAIAFATLLPVPLLAFVISPTSSLATGQLWLATVVLACVSVLEIWSLQIPMGIHVRRWWKKGGWRALTAPFVLPGWPSASLFAALWLVIVAVNALFGFIQLPSADPFAMAWLFVLLWVALIFPMVMLSFVPSMGKQAPFVYFFLQAGFGILAIIESNASTDGMYNPIIEGIREIIHWLPISSFWLQTENLSVFPADKGEHFMGQFVMVLIVTALAIWRMTFYWRWVRTQALLARREAAASGVGAAVQE